MLGFPFSFTDFQEQLFAFRQGMVSGGFCVHTDHLLALNSYFNPDPQSASALSLEVYSPLELHQWMQDLQHHPDKDFSFYIIQGIFRISFDRAQPLHPAISNLHSTHPLVISDYLDHKVSLTRMWKFPCHCSPPGIHTSPLGVIPKKQIWQMVFDSRFIISSWL